MVSAVSDMSDSENPVSPGSGAGSGLPIPSNASRDEMNLAEFPLTVLSTRANPDIKTLEFTDFQRLKNGELIERKWIITGADKFGLPTASDDDVVLGLIRLTMSQGFRDPKVYFTRYELLKALRWSTEGRNYQRLTKSLDRLSGVRIRASNAFFDNSSKSYQTRNFGVIDAYEINDSRSSSGEETKSYFIWSEALFSSFKAGFIKKLDLDLYFSLKSAVSRRLYRYLDKHFYYRSSVEKNLMTLGFEKLGVSRNYKFVSSVKQQIEPGAKELVEIGYLDSYDYQGRGQDTVIRFFHKKHQGKTLEGQQTKDGHTTADVIASLDSVKAQLIEMMVSRGISLSQALGLLQDKDMETCKKNQQIVQYFDHLLSTDSKSISKNPVGFLYRALEEPDKFQIPDWFSERQTAGEETKQRPVSRRPELRIVKAAARPRVEKTSSFNRDDEKKGYEQFVRSTIESCWNTLPDKERKQIRRESENRMRFLRDVLDAEKFKEAIDRCIRDELKKRSGLPSFSDWKGGRF
ncbi:MAG: replication initiator protein A [bacterium]|nr:replication initiator protein A [bacterium]